MAASWLIRVQVWIHESRLQPLAQRSNQNEHLFQQSQHQLSNQALKNPPRYEQLLISFVPISMKPCLYDSPSPELYIYDTTSLKQPFNHPHQSEIQPEHQLNLWPSQQQRLQYQRPVQFSQSSAQSKGIVPTTYPLPFFFTRRICTTNSPLDRGEP